MFIARMVSVFTLSMGFFLGGIAGAQVVPSTVITTHTLSGPGVGGPSQEFYIPGRTFQVNVTLNTDVPGTLAALRYRITLPSGFTLVGLGGANPPDLTPLGSTGTLDFIYTRIPTLPAQFSVSVAVPAGARATYTLAGRASFRIGTAPLASGNVVSNVLQPDTVAPVIALLGSSRLTVDCRGTLVDPGVNATDNAEGNLTGNVLVSGNVDVFAPGTYTRTYTLTDASGNIAAPRTRNVVVLNNCPSTGEGEGEDNCATNCVGAPATDTDGDGLTNCQEDCLFGTSPLFADSDQDGMDDKFESTFAPPLDPNRNDAALDADGDGFTNLQEYLRNSKPDDANDPQLLFVVSTNGGSDSTGTGTRALPWATINFGIAQAATRASATEPVRVIVLGGTYSETVVMEPNVNVSGEILVAPGGSIQPVIEGSVVAADHANLSAITVDGTNAVDVLLDARGADEGGLAMTVTNVIFRRGGIGILSDGLRGNEITIESCKFNQLAIGADIRGAIPALRRSSFGDISAPAGETATGVYVEANTLAIPEDATLGDTTDPTVGFNQFNINTIDGPAIINERGSTLKMELNDWKSNDAEAIAGAIAGPADFEPFLGAGRSILAAGIFCTVIDGATQNRVTDASVNLIVSAYAPVTANTDGVYTFGAVLDGSYQLTATAEGFAPATAQVFVRPGENVGAVVTLGQPATTPGGCNANNAQTAKLRDQAGDLLLAGIALAGMVGVGRFARRP